MTPMTDIWTLLFAVGCCVVVARAFDSLGAMIPGSSWGGLYETAGRAVAILDDGRARSVDDDRRIAIGRPAQQDLIEASISVVEGGTAPPTHVGRVPPSTPRWRGGPARDHHIDTPRGDSYHRA